MGKLWNSMVEEVFGLGNKSFYYCELSNSISESSSSFLFLTPFYLYNSRLLVLLLPSWWHRASPHPHTLTAHMWDFVGGRRYNQGPSEMPSLHVEPSQCFQQFLLGPCIWVPLFWGTLLFANVLRMWYRVGECHRPAHQAPVSLRFWSQWSKAPFLESRTAISDERGLFHHLSLTVASLWRMCRIQW